MKKYIISGLSALMMHGVAMASDKMETEVLYDILNANPNACRENNYGTNCSFFFNTTSGAMESINMYAISHKDKNDSSNDQIGIIVETQNYGSLATFHSRKNGTFDNNVDMYIQTNNHEDIIKLLNEMTSGKNITEYESKRGNMLGIDNEYANAIDTSNRKTLLRILNKLSNAL